VNERLNLACYASAMHLAALAMHFCLVALPTFVAIAICVAIERRWPARVGRRTDGLHNVKLWLVTVAAEFLAAPVLAGVTTLTVNAAGGGIIELPSTGWGLIVGVAVYLVSMDLGEYLFHRAQHALPWMWAMHSLHHSDTEFDATTTVRHFWLDPLMKSVTIWLAVGVLFKAAPVIVAIYVVFTFYNFLTHSNIRLGLGKAWWVWNSPQYHRIHHSASREHCDVNFAALLPIFDVISGTYYRPKKDEYPATGLGTGQEPQSLVEAVTWPLHMRTGTAADAPAPTPTFPETHGAGLEPH
jgi:sterol desaturase/sphingolipid hydroxylase (fatty acid hydroxylase superfamily)